MPATVSGVGAGVGAGAADLPSGDTSGGAANCSGVCGGGGVRIELSFSFPFSDAGGKGGGKYSASPAIDIAGGAGPGT